MFSTTNNIQVNDKDINSIILVSNLPPKCTNNDIFNCFSQYGNVMSVMKIHLEHDNTLYEFNKAYVMFDSTGPIYNIISDDIDIMLDDFYLDIYPVVDCPLIWNTMVLVGLGNEINYSEIYKVLPLINNPIITEFRENETVDDGYCLVEYANADHVNATKELGETIEYEEMVIGFYPFPTPDFKYYRCRPSTSDFSNLKNALFQDFIIESKYKKYYCSKIIYNMNCDNEVKEKKVSIGNCNNASDLVNYLYGSQIIINNSNAYDLFVAASKMGIEQLIDSTSLFLYEQLNESNFVTCLEKCKKDGVYYRFILVYIATHILTINLEPVIEKNLLTKGDFNFILAHRCISNYDWSVLNKVVAKLPTSLVSIANVMHVDNPNIDLNKGRLLLTDKFEEVENKPRRKFKRFNFFTRSHSKFQVIDNDGNSEDNFRNVASNIVPENTEGYQNVDQMMKKIINNEEED